MLTPEQAEAQLPAAYLDFFRTYAHTGSRTYGVKSCNATIGCWFDVKVRPLRVEYPGAIYHVTSRGNALADIYLDDSDWEKRWGGMHDCKT